MNLQSKTQRIKTLQYAIASRWFLHAGILLLGIVQLIIGANEFSAHLFWILLVTYTYNSVFYFLLKRPTQKISHRSLYVIGVLQLVFDQIAYTVILYATGGVESLAFLFYFLTIFMGIVLLREWEIVALTFASALVYVGIIAAEYMEIIPHQVRYVSDPSIYGNLSSTVGVAATVSLMFMFSALFAAFITNLIRTREKSIATERDTIGTIVDNLVDGVLLLTLNGKVLLMNPYAQRILHVNREQLEDYRLSVDQFPSALQELVEHINEIAADPVYRTDDFEIEEGSERIILHVTTLQITDTLGESFGTLIILKNITREKDLDQLKSEFISVAAHQLRTPLATLKWLFKIMLDGDGGEITEKQKDLLTKGFRRNNEVIEIVNNLLDVSEIEDGRFPFKFSTTQVSYVVNYMLQDIADTADRADVTIDYEDNDVTTQVNLDKQKLKMALQNLVDNAIKYSTAGDTVKVRLREDDEKEEVVFVVEDSGIGMSKQTKEKLFTKFFRGKEAANKEPTGSGLGLYIVRNIIERHGGTISVESSLGMGTTFTVRLPISHRRV